MSEWDYWVDVNGVEFDGSDSNTIPAITLTKDTGLFGGVSMRREQTDRPNAHGSFFTPGLLSGRAITLEGEIYTTSPGEQVEFVGMLEALLATGEYGTMTARRGGQDVSIEVGRLGAPTIAIDRWGLLARYSIQFWAPDPIWMGKSAPVGPGTSLLLEHRGNFPSPPTFKVTGTGAYTIAAPGGRSYVVSTPLAAGSTDVIDMADGWVRRNGQVLMGAASRAETWEIPPGPGWQHTITGNVQATAWTPDRFA